MLTWLRVLWLGVLRMAGTIRDRAKAALEHHHKHQNDDPNGVVALLALVLGLLLDLGDLLWTSAKQNETSFHRIERMEQKIMADESKLSADFGQMSSDLDEIQTSIAALQAAQATGNDTAVQAEIDKLVGLVDPLAAKARTVAGQFDPAPTPEPTPSPDAARRKK